MMLLNIAITDRLQQIYYIWLYLILRIYRNISLFDLLLWFERN